MIWAYAAPLVIGAAPTPFAPASAASEKSTSPPASARPPEANGVTVKLSPARFLST